MRGYVCFFTKKYGLLHAILEYYVYRSDTDHFHGYDFEISYGV